MFSLFSGCAAIILGSLISHGMQSSANTKARQEFINRLQETNLKRQQAGLPPLDNCVEIYNYDPDWARNINECTSTTDSLDQLYHQGKYKYTK